MITALRVAFLYIGTSIGAGFSSGKEIALFFGNLSPLNVAFSALFIAALAWLFMVAGKTNAVPNSPLVKTAVFVSAAISLAAMISGSEFILMQMTGIPMLGLLAAFLGGIIVSSGMEKIKLLNTVLVPLLVVAVAVIFSRLSSMPYAEGFSFSKPILYSGLDVLLGGIIISSEGRKLNYKQITLAAAVIGLFIGAMLFMLQTIVLADASHSPMPVLSVAENLGLKWACGILIAAAIFTTLVSSLHIVSTEMQGALSRVGSILSESGANAEPALTDASLTRKFKGTTKKMCFGKTNGSCCRKKSAKRKKTKIQFANKLASFNKHFGLVVTLCLTMSYPFSFIGFDAIVDNGYPFTSLCGILFTVFTVVKMLLPLCKTVKRKRAKPLETKHM